MNDKIDVLEYFAAHAMQAIVSEPDTADLSNPITHRRIAQIAFNIAQAMVEERTHRDHSGRDLRTT